MASRSRASASDRVRAVTLGVLGLGVLVYLYSAYHALEAGGITPTSRLGACAEAATGTVDPFYRVSENLTLTHGFFPPSATCHWSGGASAVLVAPTWTWTGIVLVGLAVLAFVALSLAERRTARRRA